MLHRVRVRTVRRVSTGFVRITFTGPTLDAFADPGLDQRIKLILPATEGGLDAMPLGEDWYARWRGMPDVERPILRTYTTRAVRAAEREVDVDLVLHEPSGPAGRFAAGCDVGDEAVLWGPNRFADGAAGGIDFRLPASARSVLIAGDETALPAIARILEALPADIGGRAVVEVPFEDDGALLPAHPSVGTEVLVRGSAPSGALLVPAVRAAAQRLYPARRAAVPEDVDIDGGLLWEVPGDGRIGTADASCSAWLAGEAGVITGLRRVLVAELGVDRRTVAFMGYWRRGRAEH